MIYTYTTTLFDFVFCGFWCCKPIPVWMTIVPRTDDLIFTFCQFFQFRIFHTFYRIDIIGLSKLLIPHHKYKRIAANREMFPIHVLFLCLLVLKIQVNPISSPVIIITVVHLCLFLRITCIVNNKGRTVGNRIFQTRDTFFLIRYNIGNRCNLFRQLQICCPFIYLILCI